MAGIRSGLLARGKRQSYLLKKEEKWMGRDKRNEGKRLASGPQETRPTEKIKNKHIGSRQEGKEKKLRHKGRRWLG